MKKIFICLAIFATVSVSGLFAQVPKDQTRYPYQESEMSYQNAQIYKVLDHKDAYVVIYAKSGMNVGQVSIPKKWYKERPQRLRLRPLPKGMQSYLTVFSKGGSFHHCILTVPTNRLLPVWGVADSNVVIDDLDKESLELKF